jgi:hypothetical protein
MMMMMMMMMLMMMMMMLMMASLPLPRLVSVALPRLFQQRRLH